MENGTVTLLLQRLNDGDPQALERLVPLLYDELRSMARRHLRRSERRDITLTPTALVNEVYLKLVKQAQLKANDRVHFFGIAGNIMRRFLVDYARTKKALKRGGGQQPVPLNEAVHLLSDREADEVLILDEALTRLEKVNPRGSEVIQYRFYSGLTLEETAQLMNVSVKTVQRSWLTARAWLRKEVTLELGL